MAQQGSPEKIQIKTDKKPDSEPDEGGDDKRENEKPVTWDEIQKQVDFGEHFAIGHEYDDWSWKARDLDLLFKHDWELFAVRRHLLFFRKVSH